jgi:hypothetical protein
VETAVRGVAEVPPNPLPPTESRRCRVLSASVMRFEGPRVRTGAAQRLVGEPGKTKPAPEQEAEQR